jgi:signal transduction histidine kinase
LSLITSLLDLGKLEQGSMSISAGSVSMTALATDVATTFMPGARRRNIQLKVATAADAPDALGDRERLRQVLTNLVDNALKFTPPGGTVLLEVRAIAPITGDTAGDEDDGFGLAVLAPARRDVEVRVQDSGIGIPDALREKVFDAFYQVDSGSTREYGGAGLGLAIVRKIVDSHRGKITVETPTSGRGTVFVVQLPAARS